MWMSCAGPKSIESLFIKETGMRMHACVVCPEPLAAQVGRDILSQGGNAVDASIAAGFVQGVVNPLRCGLGGGGHLLYLENGQEAATVLNFETACGSIPPPEDWAAAYSGRLGLIGRHMIDGDANNIGYPSIMVPGFVRGCWASYQTLGSGNLSWGELLRPAIRLAQEGFVLDRYVAESLVELQAIRRAWEGQASDPRIRSLESSHLFMDGPPLAAGDLLIQAELAETLHRLAVNGGDEFYEGALGQAIASDLAEHRSMIDSRDLREYAARPLGSIQGQYRGVSLHAVPLTSGSAILQMLGVLDLVDTSALDRAGAPYVNVLARVFRAAFIDHARIKGRTWEDAARLEREAIAAERCRLLADRIEAGDPFEAKRSTYRSGTTHLVCADSSHNIVMLNHSIGSTGGACVGTEGLGFFYNNFVSHFNPIPGQFDSISPGKRLIGGASLVGLQDGEAWFALGASGGSRSITSVVQCFLALLDQAMDPPAAVTAPRFHSEERRLILLEPDWPDSIVKDLESLGNQTAVTFDMAVAQAMVFHEGRGDGGIDGGSDPRGGVGVAGY